MSFLKRYWQMILLIIGMAVFAGCLHFPNITPAESAALLMFGITIFFEAICPQE